MAAEMRVVRLTVGHGQVEGDVDDELKKIDFTEAGESGGDAKGAGTGTAQVL
jgi:hypothetical protein